MRFRVCGFRLRACGVKAAARMLILQRGYACKTVSGPFVVL